MSDIKFHLIHPKASKAIHLIADWYWNEWKIPAERTIQKLKIITAHNSQFQVLMTLNGSPVATGGLYHHVSLLDKEPRFKIYPNWLALIYTVPERRRQGLGALICNFIENHAKEVGIIEIHLFTDTAERLYTRLGWMEVERLTLGERTIVVMNKGIYDSNKKINETV